MRQTRRIQHTATSAGAAALPCDDAVDRVDRDAHVDHVGADAVHVDVDRDDDRAGVAVSRHLGPSAQLF